MCVWVWGSLAKNGQNQVYAQSFSFCVNLFTLVISQWKRSQSRGHRTIRSIFNPGPQKSLPQSHKHCKLKHFKLSIYLDEIIVYLKRNIHQIVDYIHILYYRSNIVERQRMGLSICNSFNVQEQNEVIAYLFNYLNLSLTAVHFCASRITTQSC